MSTPGEETIGLLDETAAASNTQGTAASEFHSAAEKGDDKAFTQALQPPNPLLFTRDSEGNTPFHLAARSGHLRIIEVFRSHGCKVPVPNSDPSPSSSTPQQDKVEIQDPHSGDDRQRSLWDKFVTDANEKDGDLALHLALKKEHRDVAQYMLDSVPKLAKVVNKVRESPLYLAVVGFCDDVVEKILSSDDAESYSVSGPKGCNPLHAAVKCRNWHALKLIVEKRMDLIRHAHEEGKTALHCAVEEDQEDTVRLLMEKVPLTACEYDNEGYTPLLRAAELGSVKMIEIILKQCPYAVEFHHRDNGKTALHLAKMECKFILVCLTGTNMSDLVNERDNKGCTPLHHAIAESDYEKLFALALLGDCNRRVRNPIDNLRPVDDLSAKASIKVSSMEQLLATSYLDMTAERWKPEKSSTIGIIMSTIRKMCWHSNMVRNFMETNMDKQEVSDKLSNIVLVAGLILTITFAAAFTIPGGYNKDTGQLILSKEDAASKSRLRCLSCFRLTIFLMYDCMALVYSAVILIWHTWSFTSTTIKEKVGLLFQLGYFLLFFCSVLTINAFAAGIMAVTAVQRKEAEWLLLFIAVFSVSLIYGIIGILEVNYFPVIGTVNKLAVNGRVLRAKRALKRVMYK